MERTFSGWDIHKGGIFLEEQHRAEERLADNFLFDTFAVLVWMLLCECSTSLSLRLLLLSFFGARPT